MNMKYVKIKLYEKERCKNSDFEKGVDTIYTL